MTRKTLRAVRAEVERRGGEIVDWTHGQKHEIAHVLVLGRIVDISFARGHRDEHLIKIIVRDVLKRAGIDTSLLTTGWKA